MPGKDFPTNLGQMHRSLAQQEYASLGQLADGFWRLVLAPVRPVLRRLGRRDRAAAEEAPAPSLEAYLRARERRFRADLALAVGTGILAAVVVLLLAASLPERSGPATLGRQAWWLAGAFWGGFVFLVRRWLE